MKRGLLFVLFLVIVTVPFVYSQNQNEIQTDTNEFPVDDETINEWTDASDIPNVDYNSETYTYDFTDMSEGLNEVSSIDESTSLITDQGTISLFSMTNALFSLGSLIQGSFISFENNNNIYIKSVFDDSVITATINKNGLLEVGQINGIGEMGKIVVEIENGNLSQDDIVFIPSGNNPEYIYYNTTEIEFKDGNISYLGESVTNNDDSKEKTEVNFDEQGFTKVKLLQDDVYENFDYGIKNKGDTEYICKDNALCDVNIENSIFTIRGDNDLLYKDEVIYSSNNENNIFTIDTATGEAELKNTKPNGKLAEMCTGYHLLSQEEMLKSVILEEACHEEIKYYEYEGDNVHVDNDVLYVNNYVVFPERSSQWNSWVEMLGEKNE